MKTLAERLNLAMDMNNEKQASLAKRVGISQTAIQKLTSGKSQTSRKMLEISQALGVNHEWLISGKGSMRDDEQVIYYRNMQPVPVWEANIDTGIRVLVPDTVAEAQNRAYCLKQSSGCAEAPAGTLIVIDPEETPGNNDLVYADVAGDYSVYRFIKGGVTNFLSVDDSRVALTKVSDAVVLGVVVYLSREIRRG